MGKKQGWHKWFAWHPVSLCSPDTGKVVWGCIVARLWLNGEWLYDQPYRADPPRKEDNSLAGAMNRSIRNAAR